MRFIQTGRTGGDETAPYSVCDYESKTAGDFPNEVIKCEPNEFGYIEVNGHLQHRVEYKHGQLLDNIPAEWHTFAIEKIISSGGWGRMDYMIIVKKETSIEDVYLN